MSNITPNETLSEFRQDEELETFTLYGGLEIKAASDEVTELYDGNYAYNNDSQLIELHDGSFAIGNYHDVIKLDNCEFALTEDARECAGLNTYFLCSEGRRWMGDWYSNDYLDDNTFVCSCCGDRYHNDDHAEDNYCTHCNSDSEDEEEDEEDDRTGLSNYSCKRADYMQPEGKGPLYFGIELEVEARGGRYRPDEVSRAYNALGRDYVVCKSDGSLSGDRGFEIVTRPDSVEVHKRKWEAFIQTASETLSSWSNGRCGMHIHASRAALSQLQLGKMLVFLNHVNNAWLVKLVAGRALKDWACLEHGKKIVDGKKLSPNRYVALNVTEYTAELRIFKGTLKPSSFWKNLEFYAAVIAFCAPAEHSTLDVETPQKFLRFVQANAKTYPNVDAFLQHRHAYERGGIAKEVAA
jgi:hypothetical protein